MYLGGELEGIVEQQKAMSGAIQQESPQTQEMGTTRRAVRNAEQT